MRPAGALAKQIVRGLQRSFAALLAIVTVAMMVLTAIPFVAGARGTFTVSSCSYGETWSAAGVYSGPTRHEESRCTGLLRPDGGGAPVVGTAVIDNRHADPGETVRVHFSADNPQQSEAPSRSSLLILEFVGMLVLVVCWFWFTSLRAR
jgi:hypothetical protein